QLWSCLDPNFKHISQNEIYKEKEDEFDLDRIELSIKPDENPDLKLDQDINLFDKVELMDTNHHDYIIKS
ncbi:MAG: hypothetical protein MHPSP_004272, partial [Paramarteilia canceri]